MTEPSELRERMNRASFDRFVAAFSKVTKLRKHAIDYKWGRSSRIEEPRFFNYYLEDLQTVARYLGGEFATRSRQFFDNLTGDDPGFVQAEILATITVFLDAINELVAKDELLDYDKFVQFIRKVKLGK